MCHWTSKYQIGKYQLISLITIYINIYNSPFFNFFWLEISLVKYIENVCYISMLNLTAIYVNVEYFANEWLFSFYEVCYDILHHFKPFRCVKRVPILSFTGPYFPAFGLNTEQKSSEYGQFLHRVNLIWKFQLYQCWIKPKLQVLLRWKRWWTYNQFHNNLRLFDVLPNFPFTASETKDDYYL